MHGKSEVSNDELVQRLLKLLTHHENKCCADCGQRNPRWVAWNHGVFICMRCAGLHRNLGVQVSKVKSVTLDRWTEEQVAFLEGSSNAKRNELLEGKLAEMNKNFARPVTDTDAKDFIRRKYKDRIYFSEEKKKIIESEKPAKANQDELLLDIFSEPIKPVVTKPTNGVFDVFSEFTQSSVFDANFNKTNLEGTQQNNDNDLFKNIMSLYKNS